LFTVFVSCKRKDYIFVTVCHISAHHSSNSLTSAALVLRSATYRPHFNILKL